MFESTSALIYLKSNKSCYALLRLGLPVIALAGDIAFFGITATTCLANIAIIAGAIGVARYLSYDLTEIEYTIRTDIHKIFGIGGIHKFAELETVRIDGLKEHSK